MSNSNINVSLVQTQMFTPGTDSNFSAIAGAGKGGESTASFLNQQISYTEFLQEVGSGSISIFNSTIGFYKDGDWVDIMPVTYAMAGSGDNTIDLVVYGKVMREIWEQMSGSSSLTIPADQDLHIKDYPNYYKKWRIAELLPTKNDYRRMRGLELDCSDDTCECTNLINVNGTTYCTFGSVESTFSYHQTPLWVAPAALGTLSTLSSIPFVKTSFSEFIKPCLKAWWEGQKQCWGNVGSAVNYDSTSTLIEQGVEEGTAETVAEEGAEIAITTAGAACFGIVLALAAVPIIVQAIEHYSYNNIQLYNLSNHYDMIWDTPFIVNSGIMTQAPIINNNDKDYEQLIPGVRNRSPEPWIQGKDGYGYGVFSFASSGAMDGVGESFGLKFYKLNRSATTASDYDGVTPDGYGAMAINIPWAGDNDIACTMSENPISSNDYWNERNHQQVTSLTAQLAELGLQITVSIDYLSGTHPESSGQLAYYYQSVVIISDIT
ncbi:MULTISPECIES: hypothetical protein [Thalassolituus]|uniref:hypothetical protein n=1 Tax=Thalassolituus TaxID=187492 RepID=UPI001E334D73|nr:MULTISPECIES: hypothetical protein [Thalassolituus]MCB2386469.1 hypothetical protein [Thalassolituus alkanivorans]MCB2424385.1 hypothetical protein [Thalassolituus alkanivorans]